MMFVDFMKWMLNVKCYSMQVKGLTKLELQFLKRAIKETPTLKIVGVTKENNKGFSDTPLFNQSNNQLSLF